jgi:hypothetical protein
MSKYYKNSELCISEMTGKLEGLCALNTDPLTNPMCQRWSANPKLICHYCYSRRMLSSYRKMCRPAYSRNSEVLSSTVLPDHALPVLKGQEIFRFNAHGEIINANHMVNYLNIARVNPSVFFGFWTKRLDIARSINAKRLKNVNMVYSTPKVNILHPKKPRGFDKVFSVYTADFARANGIHINCHGGCNACRLCYTRNKTVFINEIIKEDQR